MRDNVLNDYAKTLLTTNIEDDKFEQYIDMFSKFLSYTNPDYKYNGTYLKQYISEFRHVCQMLRKKNAKYHEVFMDLKVLIQDFELVMDQVYCANSSSTNKDLIKYVEINKNKILSDCIEVTITIKYEENEYLFCKEYENLEDELSQRICKDIKRFMRMKKIRRLPHVIA